MCTNVETVAFLREEMIEEVESASKKTEADRCVERGHRVLALDLFLFAKSNVADDEGEDKEDEADKCEGEAGDT